MGARRRAGPAAIAAAILGAALAMYRPRIVPELAPGPRPAARPSLASTIAWPPSPPGRASAGQAGRGTATRTAQAGAVSEWRDALASRPVPLMEGPAADAPRAILSAAGAPRDRGPEGSASPAGKVRTAAAARTAHPARRPSAGAPVRPANRAPAHAAHATRGAPLALGPAPSEEPSEDAEAAVVPVAPRPAAGGGTGNRWMRRRGGTFPLFRPPRRATRALEGAAARRRVRPLLLSKLLGRGALHPPPSSVAPPDLSGLRRRKPLVLPDGSPVPTRAYELDRIEAQDPRRAGSACRRRSPHWDAGALWHDGSAHGVAADARWLWLLKDKSLWWAVAEREDSPLLRHRGLWWSKQSGVWFALHEGELWNWRRFSAWDEEGLIRLTDGVELVYSADFTKVAVVTPGAGAVLYDAYTGAELGEWLESELPRRRPRPPVGLRLPRGI